MATEGDRAGDVTDRQSARNADTALNGMVLLGEGGRVQIAVLCSALGLGIG
jgi:hypothetical protein